MLREQIAAAQTTAMKARDTARLGAVRLILAALKNADIAARTQSGTQDDDTAVADVLRKMAKQRRESIDMFTKGDRPELAAQETAELAVIESFLPQQMSEADSRTLIAALVAELGATTPKDMGRVMAELKSRHATSLDMARASAWVKEALTNG
jgi:uncharacterized protein YqeY